MHRAISVLSTRENSFIDGKLKRNSAESSIQGKSFITRTKSRVIIDTGISKSLIPEKHTKHIMQRKLGKELGEKEPLKEGNHQSDVNLQIVTKVIVVTEIVG